MTCPVAAPAGAPSTPRFRGNGPSATSRANAIAPVTKNRLMENPPMQKWSRHYHLGSNRLKATPPFTTRTRRGSAQANAAPCASRMVETIGTSELRPRQVQLWSIRPRMAFPVSGSVYVNELGSGGIGRCQRELVLLSMAGRHRIVRVGGSACCTGHPCSLFQRSWRYSRSLWPWQRSD